MLSLANDSGGVMCYVTTMTETRDRLAKLAENDGLFDLFGAETHRYALAAPLSEALVSDAEEALSVRLPDDYRQFIVSVGNGGAGPGHGVASLVVRAGVWGWWFHGDERENDVTQDFPYTTAWLVDQWASQPDEDGSQARRDWEAGWEDRFSERHTVGSVPLGEDGCGGAARLILRGRARGQVWADRLENGAGLRPLLDHAGAPLSFTGWYSAWLHEAEIKLASLPTASLSTDRTVWHLANLPRDLLPLAVGALRGSVLSDVEGAALIDDMSWDAMTSRPKPMDMLDYYRATLHHHSKVEGGSQSAGLRGTAVDGRESGACD
jgi:hypothetical protein